MTQFKANGRVKKNISSDLSPTMLDVLLYGARCGYQGTVNTNRRTEEALGRRGLITCNHNVRDNAGDLWLYPVITLKGWVFLWETNKVTRPADDGRLPIGSALAEAYAGTGPVVIPFPEEWTEAVQEAARRPYGRFPLRTAGSVVASLTERGLAALAPVRESSDWDTKRGYDFCLTDAGWMAANIDRPADDPDRLTLAEALDFVPEADADGRVKNGFRPITTGDAVRLSLMTVDHPDQIILTGYRVELTWKMSGAKSVGIVEQITDDSISWKIEEDGHRTGKVYSSVYRRVVDIRVLATVAEQKRPRPSLERALEMAFPSADDLDTPWADGITFRDLLEEARESKVVSGRKPTVISISAKLARLGFGRYVSILRNTKAHTGFKVREGTVYGTVSVTWAPGSEFDHLEEDRWRQEVELNRAHMSGLYAQALKDAGYAVKYNGYTVTVSPS